MDTRRVLGAALVVGGLATAAFGVFRLTAPPAGVSITPVPTQVAPSTASPIPPASATPVGTAFPTASPAIPTPEPTAETLTLVKAFYARIQEAFRTGTLETMYDDLGEATIERYGEPACREYLATREAVPQQVFEVLSIGDPAPWDYVTDDRTTVLPDALTVRANVTGLNAQNEIVTAERDLHVRLVDGVVTWFTDCGEPRA